MESKTALIKAYDRESAEQAFQILFCQGMDREDGLKEVPAAALQLLVSALEYIRWDLKGQDREIIKQATGIAEMLRDQQKHREWERRYMK